MPPVAFKADLLYGASGTTKTSQIGNAALAKWNKDKKRTRLVSADGGGWEVLDPLVRAGIIIPWAVRLREQKIEAIDKACQGYWPEDVENSRSPLLPPTVVSYRAVCYRCFPGGKLPDGTAPLYGPAPTPPTNLICPKCHAVVGPREIDVHVISKHDYNPKNDMRDIGLYGIEGLTSIGDTILEYLMQTKASLSQDPSYSLTDGGSVYSGGNMSYYGFVQNRLYEFVHKSHMIPFVDRVIWTALEGKGEEEGTRIPIFGPAIAGRKATGKAPQWFGNTIHMEMVQEVDAQVDANKQARVISRPVMYLRPHADPISKIPFHAKTRAPFNMGNRLPEFMEADISKLYDTLEKLKSEAEAQFKGTTTTVTATTTTTGA